MAVDDGMADRVQYIVTQKARRIARGAGDAPGGGTKALQHLGRGTAVEPVALRAHRVAPAQRVEKQRVRPVEPAQPALFFHLYPGAGGIRQGREHQAAKDLVGIKIRHKSFLFRCD